MFFHALVGSVVVVMGWSCAGLGGGHGRAADPGMLASSGRFAILHIFVALVVVVSIHLGCLGGVRQHGRFARLRGLAHFNLGRFGGLCIFHLGRFHGLGGLGRFHCLSGLGRFH